MFKSIDITGKTFNYLTAIRLHHKKQKFRDGKKWGNDEYWVFRCICGKEVIKLKSHVLLGKTKSCGCLHKEIIKKTLSKHNLTHTRIYNIWSDAKNRCSNCNNLAFKYYGSRGITMCDEWKNDFVAFYNWAMKNGYKDNLTLDRINVNGNYEPSNCRWATKKEQANNTRINKYITYNNETHTLKEWSEIFNVEYNMVRRRLELGWDFKTAIGLKKLNNIEKRFNHNLTFNNETHSVTEWSNILGIKRQTIFTRLNRGWSIEKALSN